MYFLSIKLFLVRHHGAVSIHKGRRELMFLTTLSLTDYRHSCELALPDTKLTEVHGVEPQWVSVTNVLGSVLLRAVCLWKTQPKTQKGTTPHADFRRRE